MHITYTLRSCCEKNIQIQEVFKGQQSYLSNMPTPAGSWQQEKTGSDSPERSYSSKQLADPRLQHVGVSRRYRHLFIAPDPPHLLPAGKDDPCPMHKYSLPSGAAEPTVLCTNMPSRLGVCSRYALVSVFWYRLRERVDINTSPSLEKGVGVSFPLALNTKSNCGKWKEARNQQFYLRDQICYWAE